MYGVCLLHLRRPVDQDVDGRRLHSQRANKALNMTQIIRERPQAQH